jgi:hypothetical protein
VSELKTILDLELKELLTLAGVFLSPIVAVLITLWHQQRFEKRNRKIQILRTLWSTHFDASSPEYSQTIRMIPVEFNADVKVMAAWRRYMANVNVRPSPDNTFQHDKEFIDAKNDLIGTIASTVRIKVTDRDIRDSIYVSTSFTQRMEQQDSAEKAQVRIAEALEKQAAMLENATGSPDAQSH